MLIKLFFLNGAIGVAEASRSGVFLSTNRSVRVFSKRSFQWNPVTKCSSHQGGRVFAVPMYTDQCVKSSCANRFKNRNR